MGEGSLKAGKQEGDFTLEKSGRESWPLRLEAKGGQGSGNPQSGAGNQRRGVHVGGAEEFDIPLKSAAMKQVFTGTRNKNTLDYPLPETGKVSELKVQVSSGLLGAALNAAEVLVSYPFGCTEQLVHTTIPNLVLLDLVKRAGISPNELGPLAATLTKAERNASLGIKKIIQNQKTDGGFGLWPSDPNSSLPVDGNGALCTEIRQRSENRRCSKGRSTRVLNGFRNNSKRVIWIKRALFVAMNLPCLPRSALQWQPWKHRLPMWRGFEQRQTCIHRRTDLCTEDLRGT